jgi:DnaK suppressor protein
MAERTGIMARKDARKESLLRLHQRLVAKRDSLRRKLSDDGDITLVGEMGSGDEGDMANDGAAIELDAQLHALELRELRAVERALDMIRTGRYGQCEVCEQPIPIARLQALPFTPYCIDCQRAQEESGEADERFEADWESALEHEGRMSDRELTLGDIDIDAE